MNIVLTTYNRHSYLNRSLDSLLKCDFENDKLWIYDDKSAPTTKVPNLLKSIEPPVGLEIKTELSKIHLGCDLRVFNSVRETLEQTNDEFIFLLDSDGIYNPSWVPFVKDKIDELFRTSAYPIAALSIYNSDNHLIVEDYDKDLLEKNSMGGFALALNREVFHKINPSVVLPQHNSFSWDWQFVKIANNMGYKLLCSRQSYAQHIGVVGAHSNPSAFDQTSNFIGE